LFFAIRFSLFAFRFSLLVFRLSLLASRGALKRPDVASGLSAVKTSPFQRPGVADLEGGDRSAHLRLEPKLPALRRRMTNLDPFEEPTDCQLIVNGL